MTLQEILKSQGLDDAAIEKIVGEMKQNKIFTASEENLDTRYSKLKGDHDGVTKQLTEAQTLIAELKKGTGNNEALQGKISEYENTVATLKAENEKLKTDGALKVALLDAGAKAADIDYLLFKAGQSGNIKLGEDGKLKGQDDLISGLKTQCPAQFQSAEQKNIQEHKLENNNVPETSLTADQFAKMGYQDRLKLFNEHPEQYKELSGKTE